MFHLYFGALDVILYVAAFFVAMSVSRTLCDEMDATALVLIAQTVVPVSSVQASNTGVVSMQPTAPLRMSAVTATMTIPMKGKSPDSIIQKENSDERQETNRKPVLNLSGIRLYQRKKESVVKLSDLPDSVSIPETIRRYKLRKKDVLKIKDLKTVMEVVF